MTQEPTAPPGWYPDVNATGTERWWDGSRWTDHVRTVPATAILPPGAVKPNDYLVWTVLTTILCCLPIGAVGIYFSVQVGKRWAEGDLAGAEQNSRTARTLAIVSAAIAIIVVVAYLVFVIAVLGTSSMKPDVPSNAI